MATFPARQEVSLHFLFLPASDNGEADIVNSIASQGSNGPRHQQQACGGRGRQSLGILMTGQLSNRKFVQNNGIGTPVRHCSCTIDQV